jgi:hypothetical protein
MNYRALRTLLATPAYVALSDTDAATALRTPSVVLAASPSLAPSDFILRFTPDEFVAFQDSTDPAIRRAFFYLQIRRDLIELGSDGLAAVLTRMFNLGLLTGARATAIGTAPPGKTVAPCQTVGCEEMIDMDAKSAELVVAYARTWEV